MPDYEDGIRITGELLSTFSSSGLELIASQMPRRFKLPE